jgi:hypothetical protein
MGFIDRVGPCLVIRVGDTGGSTGQNLRFDLGPPLSRARQTHHPYYFVLGRALSFYFWVVLVLA